MSLDKRNQDFQIQGNTIDNVSEENSVLEVVRGMSRERVCRRQAPAFSSSQKMYKSNKENVKKEKKKYNLHF